MADKILIQIIIITQCTEICRIKAKNVNMLHLLELLRGWDSSTSSDWLQAGCSRDQSWNHSRGKNCSQKLFPWG
jgi:hypothetical protein